MHTYFRRIWRLHLKTLGGQDDNESFLESWNEYNFEKQF